MLDLKQFIVKNLLRPDGELFRGKSTEKYLRKHCLSFYTTLLETTDSFSPASLSERVYAVLNSLNHPPRCICGGRCSYLRKGNYREFCSSPDCPHRKAANKERTQKSLGEKYGCVSAFGSEVVRAGIKKNWLKKYRVDNPLKDPEVRAKIKNTLIKRYGVQHASSNPNIAANISTSLTKFFSNPNKKDDFLKKRRSTSKKRYGIENYQALQTIKDKVKHSLVKKYGVESYNQRHIDSRIIEFLKNDKKVYKWLVALNHKKRLTIQEIAEKIGVSHRKIWSYFDRLNLEVKTFYRSSYEREIEEWLYKLDSTLDIQLNIRKIIGVELDLYLPEKKLAIEFNGDYYHSFAEEEATEEKLLGFYKTKRCLDRGIRILTIQENEWLDRNKQEIWKSIITNLIKKDNEKVYARRCEVKLIEDVQVVRAFYKRNHLQGFCKANFHIGLEFNGEVISLMSFSTKGDHAELVRFASKIGVTCVGGASRLLAHFISSYKPKISSITTFADLRYSYGGLYKILGFKQEKKLIYPRFYYIDLCTRKIYNRRFFQKKQLKRLFSISEEELKNNTEGALVFKYTKLRRIWDNGKIKFIFRTI